MRLRSKDQSIPSREYQIAASFWASDPPFQPPAMKFPGVHHRPPAPFGVNPNTNDVLMTILHAMGMDHKKLTYRFQGRDYRLTDVHGNLIKDVLA